MLPTFLDLVVAFILFYRSAIKLSIIVILFQNTLLPLFYHLHPHYYYCFSQKNAICFSQLIQVLNLVILELLTIEYNNVQTI